MNVIVAITETTAVNNHGVVKQGSVAFLDRLGLTNKFGELSDVVGVDCGHLLHQIGIVAMMGARMMWVIKAELRIGARTALFAVDERGYAGHVRAQSI